MRLTRKAETVKGHFGFGAEALFFFLEERALKA